MADLLEKTTNLDHKKDKSQADKIEKDFNDKINSNDSQEEFFQEMNIKNTENSNHRVFFASYQYYLLYRYFIFLFEWFQFAKKISFKIGKDSKIYNLFKKLLLFNINSVIDNSTYEDSIRAVFLEYSGVFLNFDKIF